VAVDAVVKAAKFLRPVSTTFSTLTIGKLNAPAILVKSKSKGFLKAAVGVHLGLRKRGWVDLRG
jgi:hypothetical protein